MNTFEVAVLRILIKRQQPMKLSSLASGFPDEFEDNVFSAISSLKFQGYLLLDNYRPKGYVSINRERRKEILQIVNSDMHIFESQMSPAEEEKARIPFPTEERPLQVAARRLMTPGLRTVAVSSLLVVGLISAIGISLPTATSPDSDFVAYPGYITHKKWDIAHADYDHEGHKTSNILHPSISPSFLSLKDCNLKPLHEQQT